MSAVVVTVAPTDRVGAQDSGVPNPPVADSCGTNVVLVLDASGSIQSSSAVDDVRDAGEAFLDALADTGSTARVLQFASLSEQLASQAEVTAASLQTGGVFRQAVDAYYNPKPPRPSDVQIKSYDGRGDPSSARNWNNANNKNQYTNWHQSLKQAGEAQTDPVELVLYITDGEPTAYDFDTAGDPFDQGPPPDVGVNTDRREADAVTRARSTAAADAVKSGGARMLAVGVGKALGDQDSVDRLVSISGPQVVRDGDLGSIDSINDVDVALVTDFDALAQFLRGVVSELCSPSMAIRKLAQTAGSASYDPAPGWDITVDATVTGGDYDWILPDTDPAELALCDPLPGGAPSDEQPRTCRTNANGLATFQWEPDPSDAQTSARVTEVLQPGYTAGRPTDPDYRCQLKAIDGSVSVVEGDLDGGLGFDLDVDAQDIITCSIWNSFVYLPDIALDKVDAPQQVRGDVTPGNETTSTFTVTNPGNTPLSRIALSDPRCSGGPIPTFVGGDTNNDGRLDTDETWVYECDRAPTATPGAPVRVITNEATVVGTDPSGAFVFDNDSAQIAVYAPAISLTKTAAPDIVPSGATTTVTYTYLVENTGNMDLLDVSVVDPGTDTGANIACAPVVAPSDPVDLAPGATATFTCDADVTPTGADDRFVNIATATGTPSFPTPPFAPDPGPGITTGPVGPDVTAQDSAIVTVVTPDIALTKTVDRSIVLAGETVTYTYVVDNTGATGLERTTPPPPGSTDPRDDWVVDAIGPTGTCAPLLYVSGDTNADEVLDTDEEWTYTCDAVLDGSVPTVRNIALVVAQVEDTPASRLAAADDATVDVVIPSIDVVKTVDRPVVLDPNAPAIAGPDVPTPREPTYTYELSNTGNVAVDQVVIGDDMPQRPGECAPLTLDSGDGGTPNVLDVGETWIYTCTPNPLLTRADDDQGLPPPDELALVTNTVTATGEGFVVDGSTTGRVPVGPVTDDAAVLVISPQVAIEKTPCTGDPNGQLTCDPDPNDADHLLVRPGTEVTYVYEVTNTGDVAVEIASTFDDRCPVAVFVGGDDNGDGLINAGSEQETWEYRCTQAVGDVADSPWVNNVVARFIGPLGDIYEVTDVATVEIFDPAISLTKSVSDELVLAGSEVTYTFEVRNAGTLEGDAIPADLVLDQILLVDVSSPANPACTTPTFVGGDDGDGLLERQPEEVWTYSCTGIIDEFTIDVAGVEGFDIQGGRLVDIDAAFVVPYTPGIQVVKSASAEMLPPGGGPVTYTYVVTNTGDVPLAGVEASITDDRCAPVTFVGGDDDDNDLLTGPDDLFETGPEEAWTFTCSTNLIVDTTNTVTVEGIPTRPDPGGNETLGPPVTDSDVETVTVPAVELPESGGDAFPTLRVAGASLLAGLALLLLAGRRRRRRIV